MKQCAFQEPRKRKQPTSLYPATPNIRCTAHQAAYSLQKIRRKSRGCAARAKSLGPECTRARLKAYPSKKTDSQLGGLRSGRARMSLNLPTRGPSAGECRAISE